VTDEKAFGLVPFYRGVQLIASTAAQPLHVFEEQDDGTRQSIKTEETSYLWRRPNPEMTKQTFWEIVFGHEVMGDAFIFVVKNENGGVATEGDDWGIWPIEPHRVRVGRTRDGRKIYELDGELPMFDYKDGGEIVHVPNFGRDTLRGINPVKVATEALGLGLSAQEYAARFYSEGSTPPGVLSSDQVLTPAQADALQKQWQRDHSGLANRLKIAVLGHGAKFQQTSINPAEAQTLDTRKYSDRQAATLLGIPAHLLNDSEGASSWGTGLIELTKGWVSFGLQPHDTRFEQAIDDALLVRELTDRYAKFDMGGLLKGNILQQYEAIDKGVKGSFIVPNEGRKDLDLPPEQDGDQLLFPLNMTTRRQRELSEIKIQSEAVGQLVRAGYEPDAVLEVVGLPPIAHTGRLPVTVQSDKDDDGGAVGGGGDDQDGEG
jgi:HK97 family phage portal protein